MTEPTIEEQDDEDPGISLMPEEITKDIMRLAKSPPTTAQALTAELGNNVLPYVRDLALVVRALVAERDEDEGGDGLSDEDASRLANVVLYAKGVLEISLRETGLAPEQRKHLEELLADATHGLDVLGFEETPEPAGQA